jgi:thiamine-monophosphate kinase
LPARRLAASDPDLPIRLAGAGDDYELLFAAPPEADEAIARLAAELELPLIAIGIGRRGSGVRLLDASGSELRVEAPGYRHF